MRRKQPGFALIGTCILLGCFVFSQAALARSGREAAQALDATIEVERILQSDIVERLGELKEDRMRINRRLAGLYSTLDSALEQSDGGISDDLAQVLSQIVTLEEEREQVVAEQRVLLDRLIEKKKKVELLEARMSNLRQRDLEESGALSGEWSVVLLPTGQRGIFRLEQTGTVVNGTYTLDGGWTGSLQGTLISRKVFLVRIDSRLGRSMEFEGILSTEGTIIRGTWINYDLAAEGGAQGQWSATRSDGR